MAGLDTIWCRRGKLATEMYVGGAPPEWEGWGLLDCVDITGPWHPVYNTATCEVRTFAGDQWPDTITRELWDTIDARFRGAAYVEPSEGAGTDGHNGAQDKANT